MNITYTTQHEHSLKFSCYLCVFMGTLEVDEFDQPTHCPVCPLAYDTLGSHEPLLFGLQVFLAIVRVLILGSAGTHYPADCEPFVLLRERIDEMIAATNISHVCACLLCRDRASLR